MQDFTQLRSVCKESTSLSTIVVDDFLMHYVAQREGLEREMDQRLSGFRKVTKELQQSWINLLKAQYIGHRIFKKEGLIKKYLNHAAVKALPAEQRSYLERQSAVPWRYSYSAITANPEADFYEMEDVFSGENYLLYSPSVTKILAEASVSLWFNLIGFNGSCWQSFGPVINFLGLVPDDIFFFATELNPRIETEEDLMADIEQNPFPYLMLISGSRYPFTVQGKDEILHLVAEHPLESFDGSRFKKDFTVEYADSVYRIRSGAWGEPPHFAAAYYAEDRKILLLTALTDRGFQSLVNQLNKNGLGIPTEPDIRVHLPMLINVKHILGKELQLNPYEDLFESKSTPAEQDTMDNLNRLLSLALPFINAGQEPDIPALAKQAGVDEETAREVLSHAIGRFKKLQDKADKKKKK
jgi:hypothetical protein